MKLIDLHMHSTCSDGTDTPTELVRLALEKNLVAMAVTDHDTVAGVAEAMECRQSFEKKGDTYPWIQHGYRK